MQANKILATQGVVTVESAIHFPYDISFIDCDPSGAVRFQIEQQLAKLSRLYQRITDCKVAVRIPHKHSGKRFFHINVTLDLPGRRLAVTREPELRAEHTEIQNAIVDAFHKITRQMEDFLRSRAGNKQKAKISPPIG